MKRRQSQLQIFGEGFSTHTGKKRKKPKLKNTERESVRYLVNLGNIFNLIRGKELEKHFLQNEANLALSEKDRLVYIHHPVFVWWNLHKKQPIHRYIHEFDAPIQFLNSLFSPAIFQHICDQTKPNHSK